MTLAFSINGARAVIPQVYSYLLVQPSLPAPVAAGRNVLIIGEADSGVPSSYLDLQLNYFTDYNSVLSYYKSGTIVDAARQYFSAQPSVVFGGSLNRLYVYKTNDTTRAEKVISSPSNFGSIVSAAWNEDGNLIRSQIRTAQAEVKPTVTAAYIPSAANTRTIKINVSGKPLTTSSLSAASMAPAVVSAMSTAIGAHGTVAGGTLRTVVTGTGVNAAITGSGSLMTLTFTGTNFSLGTVVSGDTLVVPQASGLIGAGLGNGGVFLIESVSTTSVVARKIWSWNGSGVDTDYLAPESASVTGLVSADQSAYATAEFLIFAPVTITVTETTTAGSGATLELSDSTGSNAFSSAFIEYSAWSNLISSNGLLVGNIAASVASGKLTITLDGTTWSSLPSVGDTIYIDDSTPVCGASHENVGFYLVNSVSYTTLELIPVGGSSIAAVASVAIAGVQPVKYQSAFLTNGIAAFRIVSSAENEVYIDASRSKDNSVWPNTPIGGNSVIEISYYNASVTAATLSIDYRRKMTITFTGGSLSPITIVTAKYRTLKELVEYINTLSGFTCRVSDIKYNGYLSSVLDMVTNVNILSNTAISAYNGRIKKDYADWTQHFLDNANGILAFAAGSILLKCGLPDVEASVGYLSGATIGSTTNSAISAGIAASLKINVAYVHSLFSRDAIYDIDDALTDPSSAYTIDAVNAAIKANASTASGILVKRERFGMQSFHGSFSDAKLKAGQSGYERCQMTFQLSRAVGSDGNINWFLPWMLGACICAGRAQAVLGTSMLRKSFNVSDIKHIGNQSIYSDTLIKDFDPEDQGKLSEAIEAGLLTFKFNSGFGVQLVSPDLSTRSRVNDPAGWVYERVNVLFTLDEVIQTMRSVLENFIGSRTTDIAPAIVISALNQVITTYVGQGALKTGKVNSVKDLGNQYACQVSLTPSEALEALVIEVTAERGV